MFYLHIYFHVPYDPNTLDSDVISHRYLMTGMPLHAARLAWDPLTGYCRSEKHGCHFAISRLQTTLGPAFSTERILPLPFSKRSEWPGQS